MIKTAKKAMRKIAVASLSLAPAKAPLARKSRVGTTVPQGGEITQRELRNASGQVMRALDAGASFIVTRNGVPVGELKPFRQRDFVSKDALRRAFAHASAVDFRRFQADLDASLDQDPTPRG